MAPCKQGLRIQCFRPERFDARPSGHPSDSNPDDAVGSQNSSAGPRLAKSRKWLQQSRCFLPLVAMMKAANAGQSNNLGLRRRAVLGASPDRGIPKPSVDSIFVVIVDIFA